MPLPEQSTVRPVLLRVLSELGGRARPSDVYPRVTACFPDLAPEDLTAMFQDGRTNRWQNRIQWTRQDLVAAGVIDSSERGVWKLTLLGEELAKQNPSPRDLAPPAIPSTRRRQARLAEEPPISDEPAAVEMQVIQPPLLPSVSLVQTRPARLVEELQAASVDSRDPNRLERAVADTFRFLGFEAEWIGGPGKTDVLLRAPLGIRRYTVVVDAKSTARTRVTDAQVDWLSMRSHREQEHADYVCVVGGDFAGGQLTSRALEFTVTLLTVAELAEIVHLHAETPLTLTELRPLFVSVPTATAALPQLRAAARERRRKRLLIARLLSHIDNFNRVQADIVLAKPETLLASILAERNHDLLGTTLDDIRRTLLLLETAGIIAAANGEGYVSETSVEGAYQLLAAFLGLPNTDQPHAVASDGKEPSSLAAHEPSFTPIQTSATGQGIKRT